jgi:hypothetical protein
MKSCPQCGTRYDDDYLDQCPRDQSRLEFVPNSAPATEAPSVKNDSTYDQELTDFDLEDFIADSSDEEVESEEKKEGSTLGSCLAQIGYLFLAFVVMVFAKVCARVMTQ